MTTKKNFVYDPNSEKNWAEQAGEYNEMLLAECGPPEPSQAEINAMLMLEIAKMKAGAVK